MPAGRYRDFVKPIAKMAFDAEAPSIRETPSMARASWWPTTPQAERFNYSVDDSALARAEGLDGKLVLHRVLRMRLHAGSTAFSVERSLESLKHIQYHQFSVHGRRLSGLTRLTPEQCSLCEHLEVERPREAAL